MARGRQAVATQDQAFYLTGLAWSNAKPVSIAVAAKALDAAQRPDGGCSRLPTMGSDAYATGEALYALSAAARMLATDPVYAKGVKYLLNTQVADGSWHVKSRSIWVQPYFENGFPYGHDQWISAAGTSWARIGALAHVRPASQRIGARNRSPPIKMRGNSRRRRIDREQCLR
jgi:hypothetical protein